MKVQFFILFLCALQFVHGQDTNISLEDLEGLTVSPAEVTLQYGDDSLQFGDLRIPVLSDGDSAPVLVLIHGGCWLSAYDLHLMDAIATDLVSRGYAVWNIEYRRIGDRGGGFPGTFNDVIDGINFVRTLSLSFPLDLDRVILMGHSAGGHLALWSTLAKSGEITPALGIDVKGIVSLAGVTDLQEYYESDPEKCGGNIASLLGGSPDEVQSRYDQYSPSAFKQMSTAVVLVQGENDRIVPYDMVRDFYEKFKDNSDVRLYSVPDGGHFDVISPQTTSWPVIWQACNILINR